MKSRNVTEAKAQLSQLLAMVESGEEVVITRGDKPVAKLVSYEGAKLPRTLGGLEGKIQTSDDFDAPAAEIEEMFHGGSIFPSKSVEDAS